MAPRMDPIGQRFGRLTVIGKERVGRQSYWRCRCDCGNEKSIQCGNISSGATRSCGCLMRETARQTRTSHGLSDTPTYKIWQGMKKRCYDTNCKSYGTYGGRGISVCSEWLDSFENFYADMGKRPSGKSIERRNSDGNYDPSNCVWATRSEQNRNRSINRYVEVSGRRMCLTEACEIYGLRLSIVLHRLKRGWELTRALETPPLRDWKRTPRRPNDGRAASQTALTRRASSGSADKAR